MNVSVKEIEYIDAKDLSVQLEFAVACAKAEGDELIAVKLSNDDAASKFQNNSSKILKGMKRDGVIKLFVFEDALTDKDKMESIYMINKFPFLSEIKSPSSNLIYIKL